MILWNLISFILVVVMVRNVFQNDGFKFNNIMLMSIAWFAGSAVLWWIN